MIPSRPLLCLTHSPQFRSNSAWLHCERSLLVEVAKERQVFVDPHTSQPPPICLHTSDRIHSRLAENTDWNFVGCFAISSACVKRAGEGSLIFHRLHRCR